MKSIQSAIEELRNAPGRVRAVMRALPGTGVRSALLELIADIGRFENVLFLASSKNEIEQWSLRLAGRVRVVTLQSTEDFLVYQRGLSGVEPVVLLSTVSRARSAQALKLLSGMRFKLLVLDGVVGGFPSKLEAVVVNTERVVAIADALGEFEWPGSTTLYSPTEHDIAGVLGKVRIETFEVPSDPQAENKAAAKAIADKYLPELQVSPAVRASLHDALLRVATGIGVPNLPSDSDQAAAWTLLDSFESEVSDDPRLETLQRLLSRDPHANWVLLTSRLAEGAYVESYLKSRGVDTRRLGSASNDRATEAFEWADGRVVIASSQLMRRSISWPRGFGAIWWSPPRSSEESRRLTALLGGEANAHVVQFVSDADPVIPYGARSLFAFDDLDLDSEA